MNVPFREHPSEEALERFLLNNSLEEELESTETHILACGYCISQLEVLETQIAATRLALQKLATPKTSPGTLGLFSGWRSWLTIPRLSFATTAVVAAAGIILSSIPRDVSLDALRGNETAIVSEGRPLHMHLKAAGLTPGSVTVQLANQDGSIIWHGASVIQHDAVDVTLPRLTHSGPYLLRLYSQLTKTGAEPVLIREFALNAKWNF